MKASSYEFERFYAEVEKRPGWPDRVVIIHETAPNNGHTVGIPYTDERQARSKAQGFNNTHGTGYDAVDDQFTDPTKQKEYAYFLLYSIKGKHQEVNSTKTTFLKPRNPENEPESSMANYPDWGTFGRSAKNENGPGYTVNIDNSGTIKGINLTDSDDDPLNY